MARTSASLGLTRQLLGAVGRMATARLRRLGVGSVAPDWEARAAVCERCPMRVVQCGVSYCGTPYLQQIERDPALDGCGCPCRDKAKSPSEHCPVDSTHRRADQVDGLCSCKWCARRAATAAA